MAKSSARSISADLFEEIFEEVPFDASEYQADVEICEINQEASTSFGVSRVSDAVFTDLIQKYGKVLLSKSLTPTCKKLKSEAADKISEQLLLERGIVYSATQVSKKVHNLKANLKKKSDVNRTGNKKIELLPYEKELAEMMQATDNPTITPIKGARIVYCYDPFTLSRSGRGEYARASHPRGASQECKWPLLQKYGDFCSGKLFSHTKYVQQHSGIVLGNPKTTAIVQIDIDDEVEGPPKKIKSSGLQSVVAPTLRRKIQAVTSENNSVAKLQKEVLLKQMDLFEKKEQLLKEKKELMDKKKDWLQQQTVWIENQNKLMEKQDKLFAIQEKVALAQLKALEKDDAEQKTLRSKKKKE